MYRAVFETLQGQLKKTIFSLLLPPWSQIPLRHLVKAQCTSKSVLQEHLRVVAALEEHLGQHRQ